MSLNSHHISFRERHVKAFDLVKGVEIPSRMKKPFLKKEEVPDIVRIDDYFLSDLVMSGKEMEGWQRCKIYEILGVGNE